MDRIYLTLERLSRAIRDWFHKDIFESDSVWSDVNKTGDIKDIEKFYKSVYGKDLPKADRIVVRLETKEERREKTMQCIEKSKQQNDQSNMKFWEDVLKREDHDIYWCKGIVYTHRGIIDRIRRYFGLSCRCALYIKWEDRSYLSKRWIDICYFFERLENQFSYLRDN